MATPDESWTLWLGERALLAFVDPPEPALTDLRRQFGPLVRPGQDEAAVTVRFEDVGRREPRALLELHGFQVAADDDGRFLLLDVSGNGAELPVTGEEQELRVDRGLDARLHGPFHQFVMRLVEWQTARHQMVLMKGGAVTMPEGTVALVGYERSGKTSTLLALLDHAVGYLGEDRLVLAGPKTLAAFPAPPELALGRRYSLPPAAVERLTTRDRWLLRLAPGAVRVLPRRLRGRATRELSGRWVGVDLDAFPQVALPETAPLDAIVFLVPCEGGRLALEAIDPDETFTRGVQHVVSILDSYVSPLGSMFEFAFPARGPWPLVDRAAQLALVRSALDGVSGWVLEVPPGTPAAAAAAAVRGALGR